jgi:outer membrane protein assembly factor BamD (BamD/ComL family)
MATSDEDRRRAAELYAEARKAHEQGRYSEARPLYEQSLRLHRDEEVEHWYHRLMATLGPL